MNKNINTKNYNYYLIVDLEATCCNRNTIKRYEMETIEIGAVLLDSDTLLIADEYQTFIKPLRKPRLTDFCIGLTSITQDVVDLAPAYPQAHKEFTAWLSRYDNYAFCSWGDYDLHQLAQDSHYHQLPAPVQARHINIKKLFSLNQGVERKIGMAGALRMAGLELEGTHHRGIDDARNMARLMPFILGREKLPSRTS